MGDIDKSRAWIELDLGALRHTVAELRRVLAPGCALMAVLKDNAYGHGAHIIAPELQRLGVRAWAVATVEEAAELRRLGARGTVLIFGYTGPERAAELGTLALTPTLVSRQHAREMAGMGLEAHLEIDTGMHRFGIPWEDREGIREAFALPGLRITGIYTHLACSDSLEAADARYTREQVGRFEAVLAGLRAAGITPPPAHVQSSYGVLNYPDLRYAWARVGMALYGVLSYPDRPTVLRPDLRPVLSLRSRVASVQPVRAGEGVGYGRSFRAARDGRVAAVSIGYCDGVPRPFSGPGRVLIRGRPAPVVGKICMDQLTCDVTDIPDASPGDVVTVIGRDGTMVNRAEDAAAWAGEFTPELMGRLGARLPVVVTPPAEK